MYSINWKWKMNQTKKHTWKRIVKWMVYLILGLVLCAIILAYFFSERIIKQEITNQIQVKTKGAYSFKFNDLSINPFTQSIAFSEVELIKTNKTDSTQSAIGYFSANTLSLQKIDLFHLLTKKRLHLKKLKIDYPTWNANLEKKDSTQNDSPFAFVQEISPLFNTYLKAISINQIELTNAGFINDELSKNKNSNLSRLNFNVGVSNFYTDSIILNQNKDYFNADDIYLGIDNYRKMLGDSIHELKIQKIQYSLKNKDIKGNQIQLSPVDSTNHSRTHYVVTIPEIKIKSNDLRNIFQEDSILVDSLFLNEANIKVIPQKNASGINLKKIKEYDLYQLVEGEFDQLKIKHLVMNAKKLRIERRYDENSSTQEFDRLHIQLTNFLLNEDSYSDPDKVLYSDNLSLQINHYFLLMNDDIHRFDAENIKVTSEENSISADQLLLKPLQNPNTKQTTVDMQCDSIRLKDVDLKKLYHNREMPLQSILAYHPAVSIDQGEKQQRNNNEGNSLLYHFIGNYIKGIYANVVEFDHGKFAINTREGYQGSGIIASDFNFKLTDFSLDSISAGKTDKLFFATNIDLNFSNYRMKLADQIHRLEIEQINVSTHNEQASLRNLHLFPDNPAMTHRLLKKYNRTQIYDIKIPYMVLRNTNIHQAFFRKNLRVNSFSIIEPKISFEVFPKNDNTEKNTTPREFYDLLKNYIENISIGKISAPNGSIQLVTHSKKGKTISFNNKFSIELENFNLNDTEINKKKLLFSDEFELKIEDHLFQLSDNVHYLQASEVGVSSRRSEVYIKNAILYPDITSKSYDDLPWHLHVKIPEIRLQGVDLEEAYFKKILAVNQFFIKQPLIKFYRAKGQHKTPKFGEVSVPLPKELQLLSIKKFILEDGKIRIFNADKLKEIEILNSDLSMIGNNNSLTSQGINQPASFQSDNISTTLKNLSFIPEKENISYLAEQVHFSTKEKDLEVTGLLVKNNSPSSSGKFIKLKVPSLKFEQLNLDDALDKSIHFRSIKAENPALTLKKGPKDKNGINLYELRIPINISPLFNQFSVDQIRLHDGELNMTDGGKTQIIKNINLALKEVRLDTIPSKRLLGAQSVILNLKNYAFTDSKKYYDFNFDDITFNNQDNKLSISGLNIVPRYSKEQFQKIIPFQTDHYQGTIHAIEFLNLDLRRWYKSHELTGSQVLIDKPKFNIYRDKRTEFNEAQRSKLPQDLIKNFNLPFYFDSLKVKSGNISYVEQIPDMPSPGHVYFEDLNAIVYPITNLPYLLNIKPKVTIKANTLLMGQAQLETTMTYDMQSSSNLFHVSGNLGPCDLTMLNPVTTNTAGIAIKSGQLNRFEFDFDANNTQSNGKLRFAYDNLKVSILEYKDGNTKEAKFASFLTNSLVLKSKHPRTRILLPDEIQFNRDPKRSIINYWWKSVFSGAKNTFGIKENNN